MKFSKEFTDWWEKYLKDSKVPVDKLVGYKTTLWFINAEAVYDAFHAHDEELDRLKKFEKKVRKLQDKCNKYGEKVSEYWSSNKNKSVEYEMKYDEALEEFLYL